MIRNDNEDKKAHREPEKQYTGEWWKNDPRYKWSYAHHFSGPRSEYARIQDAKYADPNKHFIKSEGIGPYQYKYLNPDHGVRHKIPKPDRHSHWTDRKAYWEQTKQHLANVNKGAHNAPALVTSRQGSTDGYGNSWKLGQADYASLENRSAIADLPYLITSDGRIHPNPYRDPNRKAGQYLANRGEALDNDWINQYFGKVGTETGTVQAGTPWDEVYNKYLDDTQRQKADDLHLNYFDKFLKDTGGKLTYASKTRNQQSEGDKKPTTDNPFQDWVFDQENKKIRNNAKNIYEYRPRMDRELSADWDARKNLIGDFYWGDYDRLNSRLFQDFEGEHFVSKDMPGYSVQQFFGTPTLAGNAPIPDSMKRTLSIVDPETGGGSQNAVFATIGGGGMADVAVDRLDPLFNRGTDYGVNQLQTLGLRYMPKQSDFKREVPNGE